MNSIQQLIQSARAASARERGQITLYPNPNAGSFTVEFPEEFSGTLRLMDISGRIMRSETVLKTLRTEVNYAPIPPGMYFMDIHGNNFSIKLPVLIGF